MSNDSIRELQQKEIEVVSGGYLATPIIICRLFLASPKKIVSSISK